MKEYLGGIYYFPRKAQARFAARRRAQGGARTRRRTENRGAEADLRAEKGAGEAAAQLRRAVESIETELAETERRIADYDARFAAATAYDEADYKAYDDLKAHYDHLMHEWEKASYELEITENG